MSSIDHAQPPARFPGPSLAGERKRHGSFIAVLLLLVGVWVLAMLFRWEIRAQWWAWQAVRAETRETRDYYVVRLASIRDQSLPALARLIDDPRAEVREAAITVLRHCEGARGADCLLDLLADEEPDVAGLAATALAWRRDARQHVTTLQHVLSRGDDPRAWGAAVALGRIGGPEAQAALCEAAPPHVAAQVIDSLGLLGCREAVTLMMRARHDTRPIDVLPYSQMSAQRAIQALQGDLRSRGVDPASALASASSPATVAGVAEHWIRLLTGTPASDLATQPATILAPDSQPAPRPG
ncbi:MAG TPA: HEAT repeat domain-containing protein [Phycisphaerae bacterium]|nr:HEAT repeat domain-containing protein [Phycisphaerae bacterium]